MQTPRDARAAARDQRQNLQLPQHGLGRAELIRSRSPSPNPVGANGAANVFDFPPPQQNQFENANMATQEQLDAIRDSLRNEIRAEMRNETAAAAAQVPDAIKRKPEIPAFDKKNVDHWIRRTENAFIRALCNTPREKFAFLETKFPVDFNPRINEFLWGDPTDAKWTEFLNYLRLEYGTTKQQRAAIILDGFKRESKRPSQYVALLNEKTKDLSLEDVKKEMLIRELPTDVQRMLQERLDNLSLEEAAKFADAYFDQDGKPRQSSKTSQINAVQTPCDEFTAAQPDNTDDINAINRRFQRNGGQSNQRGGRNRPQKPQPTTSQSGPPRPKLTPANDPSLCYYHNWYGDKAKKCDVGCSKFDEKRFAGNGKAGQR